MKVTNKCTNKIESNITHLVMNAKHSWIRNLNVNNKNVSSKLNVNNMRSKIVYLTNT